MEQTRPALSVILPTSDGLRNISRTLRALRAQTARHRIELVIVAPSASIARDPILTDGFADVKFIGIGPMKSSNGARHAGIAAATAPIVALAEDHSFPEPGWAEALLAAHEEGTWAVVGPVVCNANPTTAVSWSNFLLEYGPWMESTVRGPVEHLPGHNSSYRRDLLLSYGDDLERLMEAESVLQWDLARKGHRLLIEPDARTHHLNFSKLSSSLGLRFNGGRLFGAMRAAGWSPAKRMVYALGAPLIPLVRLRRSLTLMRQSVARRHLFPRVLPPLLLGLTLDALGELVGYVSGAGSSSNVLCGIEFDRYRFLCTADQREFDAEAGACSRMPA